MARMQERERRGEDTVVSTGRGFGLVVLIGLLSVVSAGWAGEAGGGKTRLDPPVLLPDGTEFVSWEVPLTFSKTYVVDRKHAQAGDDNPGTEDLPFKTINKAAQVLQPGERVVVKPGVYRECVRPARGGTGPAKMISYEAEGEVTIKGSMVVDPSAWRAPDKGARVWTLSLKEEWFGDYNPFALRNDRKDTRHSFTSPVYKLKCGLVFQNGRRLKQVPAHSNLLETAGTYWVENDSTVQVRPWKDRDPLRAEFEITTRAQVFAPEKHHLGYIRVKGFTIEHAAHRFPISRVALLSTSRGHHWIIESNTVRQAGASGIAAGVLATDRGGRVPKGQVVGHDIIRGNTVTDCGICGIGCQDGGRHEDHPHCATLLEDNTVLRTGWQGCETRMESAAVKLHWTRGCVIRRNVIMDTFQGSGIWLDWKVANTRATQNVIVNTKTIRAGIYVEAVTEPNMVDHNIIWGCSISRDPKVYAREFGGMGILSEVAEKVIVAHNLVAHCEPTAIRMSRGNPTRTVGNHVPPARGHRVWANILMESSQGLILDNEHNTSDYNVYATSLGRAPLRITQSNLLLDLAAWQEYVGLDPHGSETEVKAKLNRKTMEFTLSLDGEVGSVPRLDGCTYDFMGKPRPENSAPGPFATLADGDTPTVIDLHLKGGR